MNLLAKLRHARILLICLIILGCTDSGNQSSSVTMNSPMVLEAAQAMNAESLMAHINTLSSDNFEGRAPATAGGLKTVEYIEDAFTELGLQPAFKNDEGATYRQSVPLIQQTVTNTPVLRVDHLAGVNQSLAYKEDVMLWTNRVTQETRLTDSQLVFVGYGVVAPEYGWNDYAGIDMTGKTAVILVNDPGYRASTDELFKGQAMTYYGRWSYKFEEAARQGAAGALIVHETGAAGYPWEVVSGSWSGAQYMLFSSDKNAGRVAVEGWITKDSAQALFARQGLDYVGMVERASQGSLSPLALDARVSTELVMTSQESVSYNVGGLLVGNQVPDETFIYTAHWDHLGTKEDTLGEDKIFNGAQDNATGVAALFEIASAFNELSKAPRRSVLFLAVTAEESGLLGSLQYAESPAIPMHKTVAGVNMDALTTAGATDDVVVIGFGNSQMDRYLTEAVAPQNRSLVPEPTPEKGYFYRSDHFNLAKKGVPMLYAKAGTSVRDKDPDYGAEYAEDYIQNRYHKASDEVQSDWDVGGMMQDIEAYFKIGYAISDSSDWPTWTVGNEFEAVRKASLEAAR